MPKPELAIIITSYQMPWHLERALVSLANQKIGRRIEVIVSDDGSTDNTPDVVQRFASQVAFPVRFITHPHEGFQAARCRNEGVRHSTAPHLHFFDGDCLLPPAHLQTHLDAWRPGVTTCGYCARLERDVSEQVTLETVTSGQFTAWASAEQRRSLRKMHLKRLIYSFLRHPTRPAFISTDFSLSREDFERVNGFDENFCGWGCEDDDFGLRLRAAGVRMRSVLNQTYIYHLWHPPAPSRPAEWKQGANVAYLQRKIRLTRCLRGRQHRSSRDLTVHLAPDAAGTPAVRRLVNLHGWRVVSDPSQRADLELACSPGEGRFAGRADCRVLACVTAPASGRLNAGDADVVLAPSGMPPLTTKPQVALDDVGGLWQLLLGEPAKAGSRQAA